MGLVTRLKTQRRVVRMTSVTCAPQLGVKVRCGFLGVKVRVRVA